MRTMRGYRNLKNSNSINRIADISQALTNQLLERKETDFQNIYLELAEKAEISCRQYLVTRVAGINLNRALLYALGKPSVPVVYYLPPEWRETIQSRGLLI